MNSVASKLTYCHIGFGSVALFVLLLLVFLYSMRDRPPSPSTDDQQPVAVYKALELAVHALDEKALLDDFEYEIYGSRGESTWVFQFELQPSSPDFGYTVVVYDSGKVRIGR